MNILPHKIYVCLCACAHENEYPVSCLFQKFNQIFLLHATGMAFTPSNVLRAVWPVKNWWGVLELGDFLYISEEKRKEIQQLYSDPEEQKRQLIIYWMSTDPLASWRRLIRELDYMSQSPVADAIRDFAEPLAAGAVHY